jgi:predicted Zn-dependent peptidase
LKQNESWLAAMADADEDHRDQRDFLRVPEIAKALTKENLRDAAKYYINTGQVARFTLLPEDTPKTEPAKP